MIGCGSLWFWLCSASKLRGGETISRLDAWPGPARATFEGVACQSTGGISRADAASEVEAFSATTLVSRVRGLLEYSVDVLLEHCLEELDTKGCDV